MEATLNFRLEKQFGHHVFKDRRATLQRCCDIINKNNWLRVASPGDKTVGYLEITVDHINTTTVIKIKEYGELWDVLKAIRP